MSLFTLYKRNIQFSLGKCRSRKGDCRGRASDFSHPHPPSLEILPERHHGYHFIRLGKGEGVAHTAVLGGGCLPGACLRRVKSIYV